MQKKTFWFLNLVEHLRKAKDFFLSEWVKQERSKSYYLSHDHLKCQCDRSIINIIYYFIVVIAVMFMFIHTMFSKPMFNHQVYLV